MYNYPSISANFGPISCAPASPCSGFGERGISIGGEETEAMYTDGAFGAANGW